MVTGRNKKIRRTQKEKYTKQTQTSVCCQMHRKPLLFPEELQQFDLEMMAKPLALIEFE